MELERKFFQNCGSIGFSLIKKHCENNNIQTEESSGFNFSGKVWDSLILGGNANFKIAINCKFSTIGVLNLGTSVFNDLDENKYSDHVKDFIREFLNVYMGHIKGTFNNLKINFSLSLPIIAKEIEIGEIFGNKSIKSMDWLYKDGASGLIVGLHFFRDEMISNEKFEKFCEKLSVSQNKKKKLVIF